MPASTFNTTHLLPSRLAHPVFATPVDIRHSTHKNLGAFLKLCEKEGLITLKQSKGDVLLAGVSKNHPEVLGHRYALLVLSQMWKCRLAKAGDRSYRTMQQDSEKLQKKEAREKDEEDRRRGKAREMTITEFWKPHQTTLRFFEEAGKECVHARRLFIYPVADLGFLSQLDGVIYASGAQSGVLSVHCREVARKPERPILS